VINDARVDEIRLELRKLQQEKEDYEDCSRDFKNEITEDADEAFTKMHDLRYQHEAFCELKDQELIYLTQDSQESYNQIQDICGDLLALADEECRKYIYHCEGKEDELLRELKRLEVM